MTKVIRRVPKRWLKVAAAIVLAGGCVETTEKDELYPSAESHSPAPPPGEVPGGVRTEAGKKKASTGNTTRSSERKGERHPTPLTLRGSKQKGKTFSCPTAENSETVPRPLFDFRTLKGSELVEPPGDTPPPWHTVFGKDYIAVQGLEVLNERGLLGICSATNEFIALRVDERGKGTRAFTLRTGDYLREAEPNQGVAHSVQKKAGGGGDSLSRYGRCESIEVTPDTLFFSHRADQFSPRGYVVAYDLGSPTPTQKAFRAIPGESYGGMALTPNGLAVAAFDKGVLFLNEQLQVTGRVTEPKNAWDVAAFSDYLMVADGPNGLAVISVRSGAEPRTVRHVPLPGFAKRISPGPDGTFFVALGSGGFVQVDMADPENPAILQHVTTPGSVVDIATHGNAVAVADWTSLRLYRAESDGTLTLVDSQHTNSKMGRAMSVTMDSQRIFVGDWRGVHTFQFDVKRMAPILTFRQRTLSLGSSTGEGGREATVRLTNEGERPAAIFATGITGEGFEQIGPSPPTLGPGESANVTVRLSSDMAEQSHGVFTVCGSTGPVTLKLKGNAQQFGKGKDAPNVVLQLTDGKTQWKLEEHRGKPVLLVYFATF